MVPSSANCIALKTNVLFCLRLTLKYSLFGFCVTHGVRPGIWKLSLVRLSSFLIFCKLAVFVEHSSFLQLLAILIETFYLAIQSQKRCLFFVLLAFLSTLFYLC